MLGLFPDKSVWREGHCGIPFLHWFPKGSTVRIYYSTIIRLCGFGHHKNDKTSLQWSRDFCNWLDRWTYYRDYSQISLELSVWFKPPVHIEPQWLDLRMKLPLPASVKKMIVNKLGGLVFWCEKH